VVDAAGRLLGTLTRGDLQGNPDGERLADIAAPVDAVACPDETLRLVVNRMAETAPRAGVGNSPAGAGELTTEVRQGRPAQENRRPTDCSFSVEQLIDRSLPILIVDDSSFLRKRVRSILDAAGYALVEADNGVSALAALDRQPVACVLTDLVMPEMDGFGLLEEIQKRGLRRPVVVLTADIQKTTHARCEELGATAFLQKPVNAAELLSLLPRVLGEQ
jgi:CheY-like chemotaxis protein